MSAICLCDDGAKNLGLLSCFSKSSFGITRRFLLVPLRDDDGNLNKIDLSIPITQSVIEGWINNPADQRFYLTPSVSNRTNERAETEYTTRDSGKKIKNRKGVRTETALIDEVDTLFLSRLASFECGTWGIYHISDDKKSIRGKKIGDDNALYPIEITAFDTNWQDHLDTQPEAVFFSFDYALSEKDTSIAYIRASDVVGTFEGVQGLLDVELYEANSTAVAGGSDIVVDLRYIYGVGQFLPVHKGVTLAELDSVYDATNDVTLTPTGLVEDTINNLYTITVSETLGVAGTKIQPSFTQIGYDFTDVNSTPVETV